MTLPVLEFRNIEKRFFGTRVLKDVSFPLGPGRVLGLVGENGAGKSTLINILGGILSADGGEMRLAGETFAPRIPEESTKAGISLVHQELNLFGNLSIAENMFLTDFPVRRLGGVSWVRSRQLRQQAAELLQSVRVDLEPSTPINMLSPGERQLVEIAKALRASPKIIVFDEPTTSLSQPEAERLFDTIGRLRDEGVSIIYISHTLADVLRLCDDIVVLRDGEVQAIRPRTDFTTDELIALMVGRKLEALYPERRYESAQEKVLEVKGLSQRGVVHDISFSLHRGELLGISGLMGAGRTELARILFGLDPFASGEIHVRGVLLKCPSPGRCIQRGVALLTEDRRAEGLLLDANIEDNIALASLDDLSSGWLGMIRRRALLERAGRLTRSLAIECQSLQRQAVRTLSGGNQQKVVLAKWLSSQADILILDEPTRGVDVGAKHEIYVQICDLVSKGASVLMISSELEELVGLCDRVLVMANGEIQSTVTREEFDRDEMLRAALGEKRGR